QGRELLLARSLGLRYVSHFRGHRSKRDGRHRRGLGLVELVARSEIERAFDDGELLIGRMPVGRDFVSIGHFETNREHARLSRVALKNHHLGSRRKVPPPPPPLQLSP